MTRWKKIFAVRLGAMPPSAYSSNQRTRAAVVGVAREERRRREALFQILGDHRAVGERPALLVLERRDPPERAPPQEVAALVEGIGRDELVGRRSSRSARTAPSARTARAGHRRSSAWGLLWLSSDRVTAATGGSVARGVVDATAGAERCERRSRGWLTFGGWKRRDRRGRASKLLLRQILLLVATLHRRQPGLTRFPFPRRRAACRPSTTSAAIAGPAHSCRA